MGKITISHWRSHCVALACGIGGLWLLVAMGCDSTQSELQVVSEPAVSLPDDDQLLAALDEAIDWTYENRILNLQDHAAWQILHGIVAYQRAFLIEREPGGERIGAVDYLLEGGAMKGWSLRPGIVLDEATDRRGLIAELDFGSKTGQGHPDQWLGYLAHWAWSLRRRSKPGDEPIPSKTSFDRSSGMFLGYPTGNTVGP